MPLDIQLVYDVEPAGSATRGLRPVQLPSRRSCYPEIWLYEGHHPQLPESSKAIIYASYVYFIDSSAEGKQKARALAERLEVPYGRLDTMREKEPGTATPEECNIN